MKINSEEMVKRTMQIIGITVYESVLGIFLEF